MQQEDRMAGELSQRATFGEGGAGRYAFQEYELEERPGLVLPERSGSPVAALAAVAGSALNRLRGRSPTPQDVRRKNLYTLHNLRKDPDVLREVDTLQDIPSDRERQRLKHEAADRVEVLERKNFLEGGLSAEDLRELLVKKTVSEKKPFRRYDAIRKHFNEFLRAYDAALVVPRNPETIARLRHVRDRVVPELLSTLDLEHQRDDLLDAIRALNEGAAVIPIAARVAREPPVLIDAPAPVAARGNGLSAENFKKFYNAAGAANSTNPQSWSIFTGQPQPPPGPGILGERLPGGEGGGGEARRPSRRQRGGRRRTQKSSKKSSKRSTRHRRRR